MSDIREFASFLRSNFSFWLMSSKKFRYYKDTHKILGQTYGMLVLQDFEAITPNLLARTIETVQGGGIVVCLLTGMKSLRGLYSLSMVSSPLCRAESI